jgi:ribosome-binding factor A
MDIKEAYVWLDKLSFTLKEDDAFDKVLAAVEIAKGLIREKIIGISEGLKE